MVSVLIAHTTTQLTPLIKKSNGPHFACMLIPLPPPQLCGHVTLSPLIKKQVLGEVLQPGDRVVVAHGGTGGRGVVAPSRLQKQKELDKEYKRAQVGWWGVFLFGGTALKGLGLYVGGDSRSAVHIEQLLLGVVCACRGGSFTGMQSFGLVVHTLLLLLRQ